MGKTSQLYTLAEAAAAAAMPRKTLRNWCDREVVTPTRDINGYRVFTHDDVATLRRRRAATVAGSRGR